MAHIADLMVEAQKNVGLNNFIARELSSRPSSPRDAALEVPQKEEKETYVWRMNQPSDSRKYQLFPSTSSEKLSSTGSRSTTPDTISSTSGALEKERPVLSSTRPKAKEQNLIRRRKISVPELGPMTTVQEVAMDSPTIPGRPALHERSISAPGNSWRQHVFGESMLSCISGPALDENAEIAISTEGQRQQSKTSHTSQPSSNSSSRSASPKNPSSPKKLAPLVIPSSQIHRVIRKPMSNQRMRSESTPPEVPPKSARIEVSPHPRTTPTTYVPYTPMSASSAGLLSASTAPTSFGNSPNSAYPYTPVEGRASPKPSSRNNSHTRNQSETQSATSASRTFPHSQTKGHRRTESEGGSSIMDRGRPKKRPTEISTLKRSPSKRTPSEEQKAFEHLPAGHVPTQASTIFASSELLSLRTQAIGQASRFQVLSQTDVATLSRELRALDERCEYLRKTHKSLRSGRRNLHERICSYLRSPRVARFSHESMLKQEEALSELDNSIDDWVSKLEQAENRRTRVRQKLLEHVAAALILPPASEEKEQRKQQHIGTMENMSIRDLDTPPRSPIKAQSPEKLERVVEEVPVSSPESNRRRDVESIRIYADSDISALLADVEDEINRMGEQEKADREKEERERKISDTVDAGITLNAVAFEGMIQHKRSQDRLRAQLKLAGPAFV